MVRCVLRSNPRDVGIELARVFLQRALERMDRSERWSRGRAHARRTSQRAGRQRSTRLSLLNSQRPSAINHMDGACRVTRFVAGEVDGELRDLIDAAQSTHGLARDEACTRGGGIGVLVDSACE